MTTDVSTGIQGLTPEQLQRLVDRLRGGATGGAEDEAGDSAVRPRAEPGAPAPLSYSQERLWILDRLDPGTSVYNVPAEVELRGELCPTALSAALNAVVRRHESLRTAFGEDDGRPFQRVETAASVGLPVVDLGGVKAPVWRIEARRLAGAHARRSFDLESGPLLAAVLVRLDAGRHRLLLTLHHIVCDGWSIGLLVRELSALYGARVEGRSADLPELPVQYADFALWQRTAVKDELARGLENWVRRIEGAPPYLDLPTDRPRPAAQTYRGERRQRVLTADDSEALRAFARSRRATLAMTMLAGLGALLGRHSGQEDVVIGLPTAGRDRSEIEGLIGDFLNLLPLRIDLSGRPGFGALVDRAQKAVLDGFAHQRVPFEAILARLPLPRDPSRTPVFQVLLNILNLPERRASLPGIEVEILSELEVPAKFDLTLYVTDAREIRLTAVFNADLFHGTRITDLLAQLHRLITAGIASPDEPLDAISLITEEARGVLPDPAVQLAVHFPEPVHERVLRRALETPDRIAVRDLAGHWSSGAIATAALGLAALLRRAGLGPEDPVVIHAHRSAPLVSASLGVLASGAAMLILDPAYPPARRARIVAALRPRGWIEVVGSGRPAPEIAEALERAAPTVRLRWDGAPGRTLADPDAAPSAAVSPVDPESLAYIASTSGSTGEPKLIYGPHRPLPHFLDWHADRLALDPGDRFGALSGLSHDPFLRDLFAPLWTGGVLCMPDPTILEAPARLRWWLRCERVTALHLTPAHGRFFSGGRAAALEQPLELRWAVFGGDRLSAGDVRRLRRLAPGVSCGSYYGATETPQGMGWHGVGEPGGSDGAVLPLGRGIAAVQLLVLGRSLLQAGIGELGEVCVRTPSLARGYLDAQATAARFVPDPFGPTPGARVYRTGDLGRYLPSGEVAFAGRADRQVKVRGFRVEPGEIEEALAAHPAVEEALVVPFGPVEDPGLAAYVVPVEPGALDTVELRRHLRGRLHGALVPAVYAAVETIPRTPDGKLDRRALPDPEASGDAVAYRAPRDPIEEMLADLWAEVLEAPRVGIDDDFFGLGGHSLLAARIAARVHRSLGVEMPIRWLFDRPTVRGLAQLLSTARRPAAVAGPPPILRAPRDRPLPLSFSQQRIWFLDRFEPAAGWYAIPNALRLAGPLDLVALGGALRTILRRHEALRARFPAPDGRPCQEIGPVPSPILAVADLAALPPELRRSESERLAAQIARKPFDLERGPVFRALALRLEPEESVLALAVHHVAADGWSMGVLERELAALYRAAKEGSEPGLRPLAVQYADFAAWQRDWLRDETLDALTAAWRQLLAAAPAALDLPTDRPHPATRGYRGASLTFHLEAERLAGLRAVGRREGASLFMVLLALFQTLLHRYGGQDVVVVGSPVAGRTRPELEELVGVFINILALPADFRGRPPFSALLRGIRETALEAYALQDLPFDRLVEELRPARDLARPPVVQVLLVLQEGLSRGLELPALRVEPLPVEVGVARFDLLLSMAEDGRGLQARLEYATDLFDATTVRRMVSHLQNLAAAVSVAPHRFVCELPLLSRAEREQALRQWNDLARPRDGADVAGAVAAQARRTPDAVAVLAGGRALSYGELARRTVALAVRLRDLGAAPERPVAVCLERGLDLAVALLGALGSGAAYVPLDPSHPAERLAVVLEQARPAVLVTSRHLIGAALPPPEAFPGLLLVDEGTRPASAAPKRPHPEPPQAEALAYVFFTSGSTGRPKGVGVSREAFAGFLAAAEEALGLAEGERWLALTSPAFDISLLELVLPLTCGGSVEIAAAADTVDGARLIRLLDRSRHDLLQATPATWQMLVDAGWSGGQGVTALSGGEALSRALAEQLAARAGRVWNFYGPTEATVYATATRWVAATPGPVPIGRSLHGASALVTDPELRPLPAGVAGELLLGGGGLARGYLGAPGGTAGRFVPDASGTAASLPGSRLYRTGDLARRRADGTIDFLGRFDHQVKVRGFRIELGEIEAVLGKHPGVSQAVAAVRRDRRGEPLLCAYVVPDPRSSPGSVPTPAELAAYLRRRLPEPMVPGAFVRLESLPTTANRKVDRAALPEPDLGEPEAAAAPGSRLERIVAGIWREVLGLDRVGTRANFFDLGGHSLRLVEVQTRLRGELGVEVPVAELFRHPTIGALAAHLGSLGGLAGGLAREPVPAVAPTVIAHPAEHGAAVAVIGMDGRFPGAPDLERFWRNLRDGVESIHRLSDDELAACGIDPELAGRREYVPAEPVLEGVDQFDAELFGFTPMEAQVLDPQHRLFLEAAWTCLEAAGYDPERYPGRIGVYAGARWSSYALNLLSDRTVLQTLDALSIQASVGSDFLATRVAYKLGLRGPGIAVQTACSTSLVAVHLARRALLNGECDMALAGGVSVRVPHGAGYLYQEGGVASPDGHCRAFDAEARGSVFGSGVGVMLLKRLDRALADGDVLHAVVRGSAVNNDGSIKPGYTAPSVAGQAEVIESALADAGIAPRTIDYVEAHGSGTPLGDPVEVAALRQVLGRGPRSRPCAIGSVKTNVGHLDAAAGVAGMIKTVLALEHRAVPPSLHFRNPNPELRVGDGLLEVRRELAPWPAAAGRPRRAGVSSFGIGGTNAHVVLEEAPERPAPAASQPWHVVVLSGRTRSAVDSAGRALADWLGRHPEIGLAEAAFTLQVGRRQLPERRALVCRDLREAATLLSGSEPGRVLEARCDGARRSVAFLLSGLGDHYPGMGRGLYESESVFRSELDLCAEILREPLGRDLRDVLFAPSAREGDGRGDAGARGVDLRAMLGRERAAESGAGALERPHFAHAAAFAVGYCVARLWMSWGVRPEALLGHSLGEYTAACLAGVFSLEDGLRLVVERAHAVEQLPAGAMLAVPLPQAEVEPLLAAAPDWLDVATVNGPGLTVVAGPSEAVAELEARLSGRGVVSRRLASTHAFHSRWMEPAAERVRELAAGIALAPPRVAVLSNVTGRWLTPGEATDPAYWARHLVLPVRFAEGLAVLWQEPSRVLVEAGPGQGLTALALQHPATGAPGHLAVASLPHSQDRRPDRRILLESLARLWLAGVEIDWPATHARERPRRVVLPGYQFERRSYWIDRSPAALGSPASIPVPLASDGAAGGLAAGEPAGVYRTPRPAVDRPVHGRPSLPHPPVSPSRPEQARVVALFEQMLGVSGIGIHDSFFELGGHSLLGMRLLARVRDELGIQLTIGQLFDAPTPAGLAAEVTSRGAAGEHGTPPPIEAGATEGEIPLSFAQERLWFLDRLEPESSTYLLPAAYLITGTLDARALARSLGGILRRHAVLRTRFTERDGRPVQSIVAAVAFRVPLVDLSALPGQSAARELRRLARQESYRPFDLGSPPLVRAMLLRLDSERHAGLFQLHHIAGDAWSIELLIHELTALYRAAVEGGPSPLRELASQYGDFARWQRRWLAGPVLEAQLEFWRERLREVPVSALPADRPRRSRRSSQGSVAERPIRPETAHGLVEIGRRSGATRFMVLLAAWKALQYRYSGEEDLAVGTPVANRFPAETEPMIGFFVNTLVLRSDLSGAPSFRQLTGRVADVARGAFAHQDVPFEVLVSELQPERRLGTTPLFQTMFSVLDEATPVVLPGVEIEPLEVGAETAKFDLMPTIEPVGDGLVLRLGFALDLFDRTTILRLLEHFAALTEAICREPDRPVEELPIFSAAERHHLLVEWALGPGRSEAPSSVPDQLAERAAMAPDALALSSGPRAVSYGELDRRAARVAARLVADGTRPGQVVGVCGRRTADLVAGLLGVWRAGAAFLSLDPEAPEARLAYLIEDSGASRVLVGEELDLELPRSVRTLPLAGGEAASTAPSVAVETDRPAYLLYTSGTTGWPKGVLVDHGALAHTMAAVQEQFGFGAEDRMPSVAPFSFDIFLFEVLGPLLAGGSVSLLSLTPTLDLDRLLGELATATRFHAVPALMRQVVERNRELAGADGDGARFGGLREVYVGGDAVAPGLLERMGEAFPRARRRVLYGPTEGTILAASLHADDGVVVGYPVGRPLPATALHLLDPKLRPVPIGAPGELWIGGPGVAQGYQGRRALTAERFVPSDGLPDGGGFRFYRTGDLARRRPDGRLEFVGRADRQIKVRGFRIEPGEIEERLAGHSGVARAVVVASGPGERPGERLIAFFVPTGGPVGGAELAAYLARDLPGYMVPESFLPLDELPLTRHGKIDRPKLVARVAGRGGGAADGIRMSLSTPLVEIVAEVWSDLLAVPAVSPADDFFSLGGHSLLATRAVSRLREVCGVEIPLREVFENPTAEGLGRRIEELRSAADGAAPRPPIRRIGHDRAEYEAPPSFAQQRLWFLDQLDPGGWLYNLPTFVRLRGRLDVPALVRALGEITRRHEALRTVLPAALGEPRQRILAPSRFPLPLIDLSALDPRGRDGEAGRLAREEARHPFDLAIGPLFRGRLVRLAGDQPPDHLLLLSMHHVISDGWSMEVLLREIAALYPAEDSGGSVLPELPVQYADHAVWLRKWLTREVMERQLAFWRERLAGAPVVLDLPLDRPRPPARTVRGDEVAAHLPRALETGLRGVARREGVTLFMLLVAAFQTFLSRLTGQLDLCIGTPIAGRAQAETQDLIGFFVNTLVLRGRIEGDRPFREHLARTRAAALDAFTHQDVPFERLVDELVAHRDPAHTPLVQVMFAMQSRTATTPAVPDLEMTPVHYPAGTAKFDLTWTLRETGTGLAGVLEFNADLFDRATAQRWLGHVRCLLAGIAEAPDRALADLPLLGPGEAQQLLREWAGRTSGYPRERSLAEMFQEQVAARPDAVALVSSDESLSFAGLDRWSGLLAWRLRSAGVVPGVPVAVLAERSLATVAALVAVLRAGGAYVPLDPSYPAERLAYMLEDSGAPILLAGPGASPGNAEGSLAPVLPWVGRKISVVTVAPAPHGLVPGEQELSLALGAPQSRAYVIYTSGTTGPPKGVEVPQRAVARLVREPDFVPLGPEMRIAQASSLSFDAATFEVWGALLNGSALVLSPAGPMALSELGDLVERHRVTTLWLTASLFHQMVDAAPGRLAGVRYLLTGGEVVSAAHVRKLLTAAPGLTLVNGYGPTENTTFTTCQPVTTPERAGHSVPIGRPITDTWIRTLDPRGRPVPPGVAGELCAGGDGLARGYRAAPGITAGSFVPDPFAQSPGERLYRTGDLARFRADGSVEFLGRFDDQVKLRGFRIELGEVEAGLSRHPGVLNAAVVVRERGEGDRRLSAFLVRPPGTVATGAEVRSFLAVGLPEHMVPSELVWVDALPLTDNGKVDRRALARTAEDLEPNGASVRASGDAPRTLVEWQIAEIWSDVLGARTPGIAEDFFDLGGHSLLATQVISRIRNAFAVELPLRELFAAPTVAGLAAAVEEARRRGTGLVLPPVEPVDRRAGAPLSFGQEWIWVVDQLEPGAASYPAPLPLRLRGRIEPRALDGALAGVLGRHEILRTRFVADGSGPRQLVEESARAKVAWIDLGDVPEALREDELRRVTSAAVSRPFDPGVAPLLRIYLFCLEGAGGEHHLLLLNLHHIVTDGWSAGILVAELAALYRAALDGVAVALPELPVQYGDYAVWQRRELAGPAREHLLGYWRERLAGPLPSLEIPTDRPRRPGSALRGARRPFVLGPDLSDELKRLGRAEGVTLFVALLALWKVLLLRYTHQEDLVVGTPSANRTRTELEGLVGYFVNDLALRTDLGGAPSIRELLRRVHTTALDAHTHREMPIMELIRELAPERTVGGARMPLFQVWFQLQNTPVPSIELPGLELEPFDLDPGGAAFDLELLTYEAADGVRGHLVHNRELLLPETAASMVRSLRALARAAVAEPDRPVAELAMLDPAERHRLLHEWNPVGRTSPEVAVAPVERRFERWAAERPEAVAVTGGGEAVTYGELQRRADLLARRLLALGVHAGARVGLVARRGVELVTAVLGILRAGAAYVPLDPDYPEDRLVLLLDDASLDAVVTACGSEQSLVAGRFSGLPVVRLGREWWSAPAAADDPAFAPVDPDELAYVIYTSGSTGRPKGVMVTRVQLARLLDACGRFDPEETWTLFHSYAFDFSVWEVWGALGHGGRLVVVPFDVSRSPETFRELLVTERVTVLSQTPSAFYALVAADEAAATDDVCLRRVVFGGESLEPAKLERWVARHGDLRPELVNMYGITETTVHVTEGRVVRGELAKPGAGSPIGRPLPDLRVFVLDRRLGPVPRGAVGELFVGGAGVARGYLERPAWTAERFVPNPFAGPAGDGAGRRLYRSGDLGRHRPDGTLEHLGRADEQLKVRGFRIEPGEIEAALVDHPEIDQAVVVAAERGEADRRLVAFVVCRDADAARRPAPEVPSDLRHHLTERLPTHMVPGEIMALPKLPLTPHGKVDRRALEAIEPGGGRGVGELRESEAEPSSPGEQVLAGIWCDLLGIEKVARERTFFELGGHSLLMTRVATRVRELLGVSLPMKSFFEGPTLSYLGPELIRQLVRRLPEGRLEELVARVRDLSEDQAAELVRETRQAMAALGLASKGPPARTERRSEAGSPHGLVVGSGGARKSARPVLGRAETGGRGSGELRRLAERGGARIGDVAAVLGAGDGGDAPGAEVGVVGFPAYERPALLERGLASYAGSAREQGRATRFVVMDDSLDPEARSEIRRRSADVARRFGVRVGYAGIEEKRRFAGELAAEADLPSETVVTALLGSSDVFMTAGANRNALLLETLDEGLLCVDDDTVCEAGAPPEAAGGIRLRSGTEPGTAFFSGSDPGRVRSFRTRQEALASIDFCAVDLPAAHEAMLGRELRDCLQEMDPEGPVGFEPGDGEFLDRLERGGRILVTTNGWVGDCGWRSPTFYLLLGRDSLARLVCSAEKYRTATASKEIVRYVPVPTFGTGDSFVATLFTGLDNRELLPPFTPSGAGEDMLFGRTVAACYGRGLVGHLPWVARHEPSEFRSFWPGEILRSASGVDHLRILAALYDEFQGDLGAEPAENLRRLGQTLIEIGRLEPGDFDALVLERLRQRAVALADELCERVARWGDSVGAEPGGHLWIADVERFVELLLEHSARDDFGVPLDFLDGRDEEGARRLCQRLVLDFGVVLVHWPELVAAARRLMDRGRSVAEDLA